MQDVLQKFSEVLKVRVFMGVEQPANFGDKGGLDRAGVDIVTKVLQIRAEALVEVLLGGVISYQHTNMHLVGDALGVKALKILTDSSV